MRHWHRLPREAVGALSLEACKAESDGALGSLMCWVAALLMAEAWGWNGSEDPSNLSQSVILWFY